MLEKPSWNYEYKEMKLVIMQFSYMYNHKNQLLK